MIITALVAGGEPTSAHLGVACVLVALGAVDGYRSRFTAHGTSNANRIAFGAAAGVGCVTLAAGII